MAIRKDSMRRKIEINISRYPGYSWQWISNYVCCSTFCLHIVITSRKQTHASFTIHNVLDLHYQYSWSFSDTSSCQRVPSSVRLHSIYSVWAAVQHIQTKGRQHRHTVSFHFSESRHKSYVKPSHFVSTCRKTHVGD